MNDTKRYYYLKLEETYFNNKIEKALRKMPSGAEMLICYLKMQLKYISSEGFITYSGIYGTIEEEIALEIDENKDIVKMTMAALTTWGYIDQSETGYYIKDMQKRVGSKTDVALRVEKHRQKHKLLQCNKNVTLCREEIELDKEIEIKIDKKKSVDIIYPDNLNTDIFKNAFNDWIEYKKKRKETYKDEKSIDILLKRLSEFGVDWAIKRINDSMMNGWKGLIFANDKTPKEQTSARRVSTTTGQEIKDVGF